MSGKQGFTGKDLTGNTVEWGNINGSIASQADLQAALAAKGDVFGPASSVVDEIALFSNTTGKLLKRATGTGIASITAGVLAYLASTGTGNVVRATSPALVTPTISVGSDATGDIYYRTAGGLLARLPIGTTGQGLTVVAGIPSWGSNAASVTVMAPKPELLAPGLTNTGVNATTMNLGAMTVTASITVNSISAHIRSFTTSGTMKLGVYDVSGTKVIDATTATITSTGVTTATLGSPVVLTPGVYYFAFVLVSGAFTVNTYNNSSADGGLLLSIATKPVLSGTTTVTSGTLPATITPSSLTISYNSTPVVRLDN